MAAASETSTETTEPASETPAAEAPAGMTGPAIPRKTLIWIGVIAALAWAFAIQTGSTVLMIIVGCLTAVVAGLLIYAYRMVRKQRGVVQLLQGATTSPEARRDALAKLSDAKDAGSPTNTFARAQLLVQDDPKAALALLDTIELSKYPAAMQDDVALLKTQLYLGLGRTADARKTADTMNLDNPARKEIRPVAAAIVAEAFARTGKYKEALALLDTIELPKKDAEQLQIQIRIVRVFARFAGNQRGVARTELLALADENPDYLGKFLNPQFRVHPELQKLARSVLQQQPQARKAMRPQMIKR
ncbi:MAG: hypothetical protein AB7P03_31015 [Kofleriaceae bacterium]